jgi:hypothetical protein
MCTKYSSQLRISASWQARENEPGPTWAVNTIQPGYGREQASPAAGGMGRQQGRALRR